MTPKETAVKGSYWFIFHGTGDVMNSKLRRTGGRVVYWSGKAATAQAGTPEGASEGAGLRSDCMVNPLACFVSAVSMVLDACSSEQ